LITNSLYLEIVFSSTIQILKWNPPEINKYGKGWTMENNVISFSIKKKILMIKIGL
jgi:hypothetical protein